jgi:peptide/nickel transport system ATP-binding protein
VSPELALAVTGASKQDPVRIGGRPHTLWALRNVDLHVATGEVLAVVGESGCGKTTLSRLCLGIEAPSSGTVAMMGQPLGAFDRLARARLVQPIFQDPYSSLNPRQTLASIIAAPLAVRGEGNPTERRERVTTQMSEVGLPNHLINVYPNQISGGQRQRAAIARALIARPQILVCDEPTSALDVSVQSQIINLIARMRHRFGLTVLFISHNLAVVHHLADRVAVMYLGMVVETGTTEELYARPRHHYTRMLLDAILPPTPHTRLKTWSGQSSEPPSPVEPPPGCPFHPRCPKATDICRSEMPAETRHDSGSYRCHHPVS